MKHGSLLGCALIALAAPVGAEFYRWTDAHGQPRISNVAPPAVHNDGTLDAAHHPYSVAAQARRLRERLAARDAELALERAAARGETVDSPPPSTLSK